MDIKKMAELVRAKVKEVDESGIFDELAEAAERKKRLDTNDAESSKGNGDQEGV